MVATRSLQFEDRKHDLHHSKYKFNSYENDEKPLSIVNTHLTNDNTYEPTMGQITLEKTTKQKLHTNQVL